MSENFKKLLGGIIICFGIIDYCGMFFGYDLTGFSFTPTIALIIGLYLVRPEKTGFEIIENFLIPLFFASFIYAALHFVGLFKKASSEHTALIYTILLVSFIYLSYWLPNKKKEKEIE